MGKLIRLVVGLVLTLGVTVAWSPTIWAAGAAEAASPPKLPAAAVTPAATLSPAAFTAPATDATPAVRMTPAAYMPAATLICDASGKKCVGATRPAVAPTAPGPVPSAASSSFTTHAARTTPMSYTTPAASTSPVAHAAAVAQPTPVAYATPTANITPAPVAYASPATLVCDARGENCVGVAARAARASSSATPAVQTLATLHLPTPEAKDHAYQYHAGHLTEGQQLFYRTNDESVLDPASWSVMTYESKHVLTVYFKGRLFKNYRAVFGRSLRPGGKLYEGDRRTPQGVYHIIGRHRSYRWRYFLKLDYPNSVDRIRFDEMRADGMIPARFREGGEIGIHGTDEPLLNDGLVNWTTGCISIDNSAIVELARLLPIGTLVIINP